MAPSFSTRSSRMISMSTRSLLHEVRKKTEMTRSLDRPRKLTLLLRGDCGDPAGDDLAALRNEALQQANVLIVDARRVLAREGAGFAAAEECAGHYSTSSSRGAR